MSSIFESWKPETMTEQQRHRYNVEAVGDSLYTCRTRFRVMCKECGVELHAATTGPWFYMYVHDSREHNEPSHRP
jgi:hypothetical protein